jgi:delta-1-pyrroline-5-carboxylate synthetase
MNAHLLILLTDVKGVYDRPPTDQDAVIVDVFTENSSDNIKIGDVSSGGRGGMGAKIFAALEANKGGVQAVVIASGIDSESILKIVKGEQQGTCFFRNYEEEFEEENCIDSETKVDSLESTEEVDDRLKAISEEMAKSARIESRNLQLLNSKEREDILIAIADAINDREDEILEANMIDMKKADKAGIVGASLKRLELTSEKISTLVKGIKSIALQNEPIGHIISRTEISEKLILDKISCPIGVLLIIFESRPDCLPQIAALAIRSGNGLLLKGGKEAEKSNFILHKIISDTIEKVSNGKVSRGFIGLVTSRSNIPSLLKLDKYIDLVIPRGSGNLVKYIKDNTRIPVMGHAEGICHIFVDSEADIDKTLQIVIDAKTNYPSGIISTILIIIIIIVINKHYNRLQCC